MASYLPDFVLRSLESKSTPDFEPTQQNFVGAVLIAGGVVGLPSALVAFVYGEGDTGVDLLVMSGLMIAAGGLTMIAAGTPDMMRPKDAFAGVAIAWVAAGRGWVYS